MLKYYKLHLLFFLQSASDTGVILACCKMLGEFWLWVLPQPTERENLLSMTHFKDDRLEPFMQEAVMSFGEGGGRISSMKLKNQMNFLRKC